MHLFLSFESKTCGHACNLLTLVLCKSKQEIAYTGSAIATNFSYTSFPPMSKVFSYQPLNLVFKLSVIYTNSLLLEPLKHYSSLMYFLAPSSCVIPINSPKVFHIIVIWSPKVIEDIWKFISCPEASPYSFKYLSISAPSLKLARHMKKLSSTNSNCWTDGQALVSLVPEILPSFSDLFVM